MKTPRFTSSMFVLKWLAMAYWSIISHTSPLIGIVRHLPEQDKITWSQIPDFETNCCCCCQLVSSPQHHSRGQSQCQDTTNIFLHDNSSCYPSYHVVILVIMLFKPYPSIHHVIPTRSWSVLHGILTALPNSQLALSCLATWKLYFKDIITTAPTFFNERTTWN